MEFDEDKIEEFWGTAIEGYVVGDLQRMIEQPYDPQQKAGNLNFAIALVALAAIELMGSLYKGVAGGKRDGFRDFIMKYFPARYTKDIGTLDFIYNQARHGLAHALMPKLGIVISRKDRDRHLTWSSDNELRIDADTLSEDFLEALRVYKLELDNNMRDNTGRLLKENRINALKEMWEDQKALLSQQLSRVSTTTSWSTTTISGGTQLRSVAATPPPLTIMESDKEANGNGS